jgi:acylphosphatase
MGTRAHVYIMGRVQGVFFRATTQKKANELGLSGWVKNLSDGRVEAVFEGRKDLVSQMVTWCEHEGPTSADVVAMKVVSEGPTGKYKNFEILY